LQGGFFFEVRSLPIAAGNLWVSSPVFLFHTDPGECSGVMLPRLDSVVLLGWPHDTTGLILASNNKEQEVRRTLHLDIALETLILGNTDVKESGAVAHQGSCYPKVAMF